jgi:hypothetical protein
VTTQILRNGQLLINDHGKEIYKERRNEVSFIANRRETVEEVW